MPQLFYVSVGHQSFCGPLIPLFWASGDVSSGFQSQVGFPHLCAWSPVCNRFPRFTSGAAPADLLIHMLAPATGIGRTRVRDHACYTFIRSTFCSRAYITSSWVSVLLYIRQGGSARQIAGGPTNLHQV